MELIDYLLKITPVIANGLGVTVSLFLIVLVLSLPAGILAALLRLSPIGIVRKIMALYVYVMRGTPLMLQILFIYYGLPFIPYIGVQLDDTTAAVISFVLNYAAYYVKSSAAASNPSRKDSMKELRFWALRMCRLCARLSCRR